MAKRVLAAMDTPLPASRPATLTVQLARRAALTTAAAPVRLRHRLPQLAMLLRPGWGRHRVRVVLACPAPLMVAVVRTVRLRRLIHKRAERGASARQPLRPPGSRTPATSCRAKPTPRW